MTVVLAAGCGDDAKPRVLPPDPAQETTDKPAKAPAGWRTVRNRKAGFSVSVPREWKVSTKRAATLIQSGDELLALTVQADRGPEGREYAPSRYAMETIGALPGYKRQLEPQPGDPVAGSPYPNARANAVGELLKNHQVQRISATVFQRKGRVSYVATAFSNARLRARGHGEELERLLASLRAQPPG